MMLFNILGFLSPKWIKKLLQLLKKFEINWSSYFISAKPSQEDTFLDVLILSGAGCIFEKQRDIIWEVWQMWSSQMFS